MTYHNIVDHLIRLCKTHNDPKAQRHAAAVFRSRYKIVASGINTIRTRCYGCSHLTSLHAEAHAMHRAFGSIITTKVLHNWMQGKMKINFKQLRKSGIKMPSKSSLMVIRINRDDNLAESKCCSICTAMMKAVNIRKVYYSNSEGQIINRKVIDLRLEFVSTGVIIALMRNYIPQDDTVAILVKLTKKERKLRIS